MIEEREKIEIIYRKVYKVDKKNIKSKQKYQR